MKHSTSLTKPLRRPHLLMSVYSSQRPVRSSRFRMTQPRRSTYASSRRNSTSGTPSSAQCALGQGSRMPSRPTRSRAATSKLCTRDRGILPLRAALDSAPEQRVRRRSSSPRASSKSSDSSREVFAIAKSPRRFTSRNRRRRFTSVTSSRSLESGHAPKRRLDTTILGLQTRDLSERNLGNCHRLR